MKKRQLKRIFAAFIAAASALTLCFAAACGENNDETPDDGGEITAPDDETPDDGGETPDDGETSTEKENIFWNKAAAFDTGSSSKDGGVAEIVQYNGDNGKLYLVNGKTQTIDIVQLAGYGEDELQTAFDENTDRISFNDLVAQNPSAFADGFEIGDITSVAVNTELDAVAIAVQHSDYDKNGAIIILGYDGSFKAAYEAGVQPDMVTFAGNTALSANEGEPREGYGEGATDPKGSVTAVDLSASAPESKTITFESFDAKRDELVANKVLLKKGAAPSDDLEPEYIAASGSHAYVALQEANAIATLDLETLEFESITGLGFKDHGKEGNGLDMRKDGKGEVKTENVFGVYMPDGMAAYTADGKTYLVTANEGDAREWGDFENVGKFEIDGEEKIEALLSGETDGLEEDKRYLLGARSFSVWDAEDMSLVFDSGDMIERHIAESEQYKAYFNCSNDDTELDSRSRKKGPEPEAVSVQTIGGKTYAFVALERQGGVMMFDITDLDDVQLRSYANSRDYSGDMNGDVAPESVTLVPAASSPNGKDLLVAANENSGTIAVYAMENEQKSYEMHQTFTEATEESADHLLIWSVYGSGGKNEADVTHDFISIKNPTDEAVDLTGRKVRYSTMRDAEAGAERAWREIALSGTLEAGGTYVIIGAETDNVSPAISFAEGEYDLKIDDLIIDNKQFSIQLTAADGTVTDMLGVTDGAGGELYEGAPVDGINKHTVVIRKSDADTDNNASDFVLVEIDGIDNPGDYKPAA